MLNDMLTDNLKLVICGTAAGNKSAELKQYYAKPGNRFWKTLYEVELTPILLSPSEYERLLSYGIGLTDLVKTKAGMDRTLNKADFEIEIFRENIKQFSPKVLCFNGKHAAEMYFQRPVDYGLQADCIGQTKVFVAPSTSGAASGFWNVEFWRDLANLSN
jgi:TDG/mug DNA glycosylase family protein